MKKSLDVDGRYLGSSDSNPIVEITVWAFLKTLDCEHSWSLHPQMTVETLTCKEETLYEPDPEMPPPSVGRSSFKTD